MSVGTGPIQWNELLFTTATTAVATGDVIADTQLVDADFFSALHQTAIVQSLQVFDGDDQAAGIEIVLLNADNSMGTENAAIDITDANALAITGVVEVATGDYFDFIGHQYAQPQFNPFVIAAASTASRGLWAAVISRGSPTYAGSLLRMRLGTIQ